MISKEVEPILRTVEKPARYTGGELNEIIKDKDKIDVRVAFSFPDSYEIGMSNLGMRILYDTLNREDYVWCERVFAPWPDMGKALKENNIPLYALESGDELKAFDIVAFTLQYEMCYTNVLYMLDLAKIPLYAKDRGEEDPIVISGGPCTYNVEPMAEFFDIVSIGEGEYALPELTALLREAKKKKLTRAEFLREASHLEGFYVPCLYNVEYNGDGTIASFEPRFPDVPKKVKKRIIKDLDEAPFPTKPVVPYIETVHDRVMLEVFRGCIRGCRFCQAGMVYRPVREHSPEFLDRAARENIDATGCEEISLTSLSISDYTKIGELTDKMLPWTQDKMVNLSLPSMRVDSFYKELYDKCASLRKSGLTFAPEAGTQRLRDVINKGVTEEDILRSAEFAFETGRTNVKLYFMNGLPYETKEDIEGIAELSQKVVNLYYHNPNRPKGRSAQVTVSVSCFVPKPFTPFQWASQDTLEVLTEKQQFLREKITSRKIKYNYHDARVSRIEAVLAKGDRRLSKAILTAYRNGQYFDAWDEFFSYDNWINAIEESGLDPAFYANRPMSYDEILPWDYLDIGVTKEFLIRENENAQKAVITPNCRMKCSACGQEFCPERDRRKK